jgi:plasmid maintenance system antidote protein VapI
MALRRWNAQDLARASNLSPKTINRFLDGTVQTTKTAGKIADAFGYSVKRYLSHVEAVA